MLDLAKKLLKFQKASIIKRNFLIPKVGGIYYVSFHYPYKTKDLLFCTQSFLGICVAQKKKTHPLSFFLLRNVLGRNPIEAGFFLNSPLINVIKLIRKPYKNKYKRNKLYYLREKKNYFSRVKLKKN
jgi:ribosomal protein L19